MITKLNPSMDAKILSKYMQSKQKQVKTKRKPK